MVRRLSRSLQLVPRLEPRRCIRRKQARSKSEMKRLKQLAEGIHMPTVTLEG
jgi:hypothetical protein